MRQTSRVEGFIDLIRVIQEKARSKKDENKVIVMLFTEAAIWKPRNRKLFD